MPVSASPGSHKWKLRQVPPGFLNGEKYHIILGNLPFKKDWGDLKNWLDQQLQVKAPPGQEARYKVDHSQTFKGDGWVRIRGLDVFNAAVEILNTIPWEHRYLIVNDENRLKAVMIRDIPDANPRSQNEATPPNFHVPQYLGWEPGGMYDGNVAQPGPSCTCCCTQPVYPNFQPYSEAYPIGFVPGVCPNAGSTNYVSTPNGCPEGYDGYCYATIPVDIQPRDVVYTEKRQVMIRNIPIKHIGKKKERPLSKDDVKGWIKTTIEKAGYDFKQEVDRIVVEHKSSDPPVLRGYAILHMTTGTSARNMVALFNEAKYENRVLTAELGKDETTIGRTPKTLKGRKNSKSSVTESMSGLSLSSPNTESAISGPVLVNGTYTPPQPAIAVGSTGIKTPDKHENKDKRSKK